MFDCGELSECSRYLIYNLLKLDVFIFFSDVLFYGYVIGNFFLTYEDHLFSLNLKNAIILSSRFLAWMLKEKLENRPFSRSKDFHFHF